MSKAWYLILLSALVTLLFVNPGAAVNAMIKGSHDAVNLAMSLAALYAFWLGLFAIIEKIGLAEKLARLLRPVVRFLFPGASKDCSKYITMNISANILGLGNASTPMAIRAIGEMSPDEKGNASQNMIMLVVISSTSLQLLPTTVIGMRATAGSVNPTDFLIPGTIATVVSTLLGIFLVKLIGVLIKKFKREHSSEKEIIETGKTKNNLAIADKKAINGAFSNIALPSSRLNASQLSTSQKLSSQLNSSHLPTSQQLKKSVKK